MTSCCCISRIYFSNHSGAPGVLMLGDGSVSGTVLMQLNAEADERKRRTIQETLKREQQFLTLVGKYMCKGGKVTFVECESGAGPEGEALKKWLQEVLGPNVGITLYEEGVKWVWGTPKACKLKNP